MSWGKELDYAYGHEPDANVRERILLLRRVRIDKQEAASVAELELHRSREWAYKWLKRYNNDGMRGLKDKPHSGRPVDVPNAAATATMLKAMSVFVSLTIVYESCSNKDDDEFHC